MIGLFFAIGLVLLSSAICSGTEAALFSVPLVKARQMAQNKRPAALNLLAIRENMNRPIATIVILNNVANIVGSIVVGNLATSALGSKWLGLVSGILTFLVIIFSEIIPKTLGENYADTIALRVARPVLLLSRLLTPLVWCVEKMTAPFSRNDNRFTTDEAEIKLLAKIGHKEGAIERDESEMIQRVFKLNDKSAAELMTPRVTMTYLKADATLAEMNAEIINSQHSRIVVISDTPDDALGMALKDELLAALVNGEREKTIRHYTHEVRFVPESAKADRLLDLFQESRQHLAVVLDEYGGVSGVVTLEDVLEILTGEIVDETDTAVNMQEVAKQRRARMGIPQETDE